MNKGFRMDPYFIANLSFNLIDFCVYRPDLQFKGRIYKRSLKDVSTGLFMMFNGI